jgi:hypothetical protein
VIREANDTNVDVVVPLAPAPPAPAPPVPPVPPVVPFDPSCDAVGVEVIEGVGECGDAREFKDPESSSFKSSFVSASGILGDAAFGVVVIEAVVVVVASPLLDRLVLRRSLKEENMAG